VISIRLFLVELAKRSEAQITVLKTQQQRLLSAHEQEIRLHKDLQYQTHRSETCWTMQTRVFYGLEATSLWIRNTATNVWISSAEESAVRTILTDIRILWVRKGLDIPAGL
jgi:hypothetical protein